MNEDFSKRLLERIETEQVKPLPRWVVLMRRGLIWVTLCLAIICAGLLGSLLWLAILDVDVVFLRHSSLGAMLRVVLEYVPLMWIALLIGLCVLEIYLLRHETHAYRYSRMVVGGLVFLGATLIGLGLYASRLPHRFEPMLERHLPPRIHPWTIRHRPPPRFERLPMKPDRRRMQTF